MNLPDHEDMAPFGKVGFLFALVLGALMVQQIITDASKLGYIRKVRNWWHARRNRPRPDTDYGLDDDATVTTFIGALHGDEPSPLLHHTGETPTTRLRLSGPVAALTPAPMPVVIEFGEDTEPMIPEGVHGYRVGRRPIQMTLVRTESTGEHAVVRDERTPIFDACGPLPVLDLDVEFDWDRVDVRERELVGVGA